ncbi:MAG: hypothetical protein AB1778_05545 [Candidatus Bipolaricaulota bacterium]
MKGLASVVCAILLAVPALAGTLELSLGGGPAATSLDDFNSSILVFNALIEHLNETFDVHPDVAGTVPTLAPLTSGWTLCAAERYWLGEVFAFGATLSFARCTTATRGQYHGAETSTISVDAALQTVEAAVAARITFLDVGLRLSLDASLGYTHATFAHEVVFEIPSEYPSAISGVPPSSEGRHTGGTIGIHVGFSIAVPIVSGLSTEVVVAYRTAKVPGFRNAAGESLDFDGNGTPESANLAGLAVQLRFSLAMNLSLDGENGETP